MKAFLFALTGLGNIVLETLIKEKINVVGLSTRKETGKFPYFECEKIENICLRNKIPIYYDLDFFKNKVDLIITATYHKKININKCDYRIGLNMHPSILPYLKGRDPINKAINENINKLGISVHKLSNIIDDGEVIFKESIKFNNLKDVDKSYCLKKIVPLYRKYTYKIIHYGF